MILLLAIVVLVPGLVVLSYPWHIGRLLRRRPGAGHGQENPPPAVTVIVPCRGLEENPTGNIQALLAQEFAGEGEILFCVESSADPVVPVLVEALQGAAGARARLVITGPAGSGLGKMHNLLGGYREASGQRLVFLDSDVFLPDSRYLQRFIADLADPGVGLVTCFPAYRDCRNIPAALISLAINNDLLGLFALVGAHGPLALANGSCLAVSRRALEKTGGLEVLRRQLLMDTALAVNILQAGYRVRLFPEAAPVPAGRRGFADVFLQSRRWHVAMWRVLPRWKYLGFAWLRSAFLLGVTGCLVTGFHPAALAVTAASLLARAWTAIRLDREHLHSGSLWRYWWMLPLVDLYNGFEVLTAPLDRQVDWRGRRYRVDSRGRATPVPTAGHPGRGGQP
jgi:ceramide glucosyltransferase